MSSRGAHLLEAIRTIQRQFLDETDPRLVADNLLQHLIAATDSEYGFVAEVPRDADGVPYTKAIAITNIAWDEETRRFFAESAPTGLEFHNLRTLVGEIVTTGKPVIADDAPNDPRRGGLPPGHPPLNTFLGVPLHHRGELIGVIGLANRKGGYGGGLLRDLSASIEASASLVFAIRSARRRREAAESLEARVLHHEAVAQLGLRAIATPDAVGLAESAAATAASTLSVEYAEILELVDGALVPRVTHGFALTDAERKRLRSAIDSRSPAATAFATKSPVKFAQFAKDPRFVAHGAMKRLAVDSGAYVVIPGRAGPSGVLGILSRQRRMFSDDDVAFLQSIANVLAQATSARAAERDHQRFQEQIRQTAKMESIGMLAGGVSHDFNNLLLVILGNLEIARAKLDTAEDCRVELDQVSLAANRAALLVKQLLAFSRRQTMQAERIDLRETVGETTQLLRRLIPENTEIELESSDSPITVIADPAQVEQVLINLCVNARDAMPDGGKITISLRSMESHAAEARGTFAELCVTDTGEGMTAEQQAHLFEPFFTTKPPGSGTGLGLAMVYGIVQQHGGTINVHSAPGRGTRVCVLLPVAPSGSAETPGQRDEEPKGGDEWLLVAEDDGQVRDVLTSILSSAGYHVITAKDGDDALRQFMQHKDKIRLALLDAVMPKKDGREVGARIAALRPNVRILYTSGYGDSIAGGAEDLLPKPFAPGPLLRRVREMLDREG